MRSLFLSILLCACASTGTAWYSFMYGKVKNGNVGAPNLPKKCDTPKPQWFDQYLDHFNPTNVRTWKQKYFVNAEYYKPGGPVFLMISGEGKASTNWMVRGQWLEYAKQYNALCFMVEHRFYGDSHPTSDLSVKNLAYLSSEQALADLAYFIEEMNRVRPLPAGTKWIAFGGSYAGSLAAWLRSKYSHLLHGAVSISGPLLAQIDFQEYLVAVKDSLKTHSQACVDAVANAIAEIRIMLRTRIGQRSLTKKFRLCDPIDPAHSKVKDIANLHVTLVDPLASVVQYNRDNRFNSNSSRYTIDYVCDILVDEKKGAPVDRFAEASNAYRTANKEKCLDYRYAKTIDEFQNVSWADKAAAGGRQWLYQSCTEFGFFQSSTAASQLFGNTFPVDFFIQTCTDVFGPRYNIHLLKSGVERTNILYGGLNIDVSNVVFVHGSVDPWHALGITKSTNPRAPAIYINGSAHCAPMYPPWDLDPPQLNEARKQIGELIGQWLKN